MPSLPLALRMLDFFQTNLEEILNQKNLGREVRNMARDLTPWTPFREVASLHDTIDRVFEDAFPNSSRTAMTAPMVNVYEKGNDFIVEAEIPGIKEEDISIEVGEDSLTLSGERKSQSEVKDEDYWRKETSYGTFSRTVGLPTAVDKDKAEAELKEGILIIRLPKKAKIKPKVTKVKVKKK